MQGKKSDLLSKGYNQELKNRLLSYKQIDKNGCWIWKKCTNQQGYGIIRARRKNFLAHRLSYELFKNEDPEEKEVCHKCDIPLCINPEHLFLGTHKENMNDGQRKKRWPAGEKHYNNRLSEKEVIHIRQMLKMKISMRKIANIFNISPSNVGKISLKKTWHHLEEVKN